MYKNIYIGCIEHSEAVLSTAVNYMWIVKSEAIARSSLNSFHKNFSHILQVKVKQVDRFGKAL